MQRPIHDYCRLGIVHSMIFPRSQESEALFLSTLGTLLADDWFDVIEIGPLPFASLAPSVPDLITAAHAQSTYSGHALLFAAKANINSLDEHERRRAVSILKEGIDEAYRYGALNFQFLSRTFEIGRTEAYLGALIRSTVELCEYAAAKGSMPLCLEIFDHSIDKRSLIGPAPLAKRYVEEVTSQVDNFGLMVDCSHIPMIGETLDEALDPIAAHIVHAHMGNTLISDPNHRYYGDNHPRFGYPGSENDTEYLAAFLEKLLSIGYLDPTKRPILSFEIKPQGDEDPLLVLANAKRTLRDAWRMVDSP